MRFLSPRLFKQSLSAHSWLGLLVGLPMYLICLSGALVVFYEELERWEQPAIAEATAIDAQRAERALNGVLATFENDGTPLTEHVYLNLPTATLPRMSVSTQTRGWYINADGTLGDEVKHEWTHLLTDLHLYLHLPETFGMILVSALGVLLISLIVSGFFAHPSILKDAFSLRWQGSARLREVDLHNRLSVWAAPFHFLIALTGAYFGLAGLIVMLMSASSGSSVDAIYSKVFGGEPELAAQSRQVALAGALTQMPALAPGTTPLSVTVHGAGTEHQFFEVNAFYPDKLIYSDGFRFDAAGRYQDHAGFSDGEFGKQAVYSVYRLHFGHFGGFTVKVLYAVLGLALTVVAATGINIWLAKRKYKDWLNQAWPAVVWGTPAALAATAIGETLLGIPSTRLFWLLLVAVLAVTRSSTPARIRWSLQAVSALLLAALVVGHVLRFGGAAFNDASLGINLSLLVTALVLGLMAHRGRRAQG